MVLDLTIYHGTFIHCKSLTELDICPNGAIGVDENGKIAFVTRDQDGTKTPGWEDAKSLRLHDNQFFFPGFIGRPTTHSTW